MYIHVIIIMTPKVLVRQKIRGLILKSTLNKTFFPHSGYM